MRGNKRARIFLAQLLKRHGAEGVRAGRVWFFADLQGISEDAVLAAADDLGVERPYRGQIWRWPTNRCLRGAPAGEEIGAKT